VSLDLSPVHGHNQHRNAGIARRAATFPAGTTRWGNIPGCCWQVECSTSPQCTHELLVRRDAPGGGGRGGRSKKPMMVEVAMAKGWGKGYRRRKVRGPAIRTIYRVISSTFTSSTLPRFRRTYHSDFWPRAKTQNSPNRTPPFVISQIFLKTRIYVFNIKRFILFNIIKWVWIRYQQKIILINVKLNRFSRYLFR